jgi:hypothetical protein
VDGDHTVACGDNRRTVLCVISVSGVKMRRRNLLRMNGDVYFTSFPDTTD